MKQDWTKPEIKFVQNQYKKGHSRYSIAKLFKNKFGYSRTSDSIRHVISNYCSEIDKELPKVLVLDIEISPTQAYVWGIYDQNVPLEMITQDWFILSWSAKWLGDSEDKVIYKDQRNKRKHKLLNDKPLLKDIWKLLNEASIVISQNGKKFDIKKLNSKFIEYGMEPPSEYKQIDTLVMAKKHFGFTSYKLAYMTDKLCKNYKKLDHGKYPGNKLWIECLKGNKSAWEEMKEYNIRDIMATEELFTILAKYDKTQITTDALRVYNHNRKSKK